MIAAAATGSGNPDDLARIADAAVALAQWWRPPAVTIPPADLAGVASLRLEGDPAMAADSLLEAWGDGPERPWHRPLARDVAALACRFAAIAGCDEVALRLERVEGNACHRFHADYVPLRLLTTYAGPGTQWRLDGRDDAPVHQLRTGDVALFKGRAAGPVGLLHRSPPIAGSGERRLVLVVDALLADDDRPVLAPPVAALAG